MARPDQLGVTATFLIATSMFLGGVRHGAEGFRLASLKGALRFWWRAMRFPELAKADPRTALATLRRNETDLFGSTDCQSKVMMRLMPRRTPLPALAVDAVLKDSRNDTVGPGARYLGFGLMVPFDGKGPPPRRAGQLTRSCLQPGSCVRVEFRFKPGADRQSFIKALTLFGLVGGLGSRVQRGWRSLALVELEGEGLSWTPPTTEEAYRTALLTLLPDLTSAPDLPPFTAFGPAARVELMGTDADPLLALDRLGRAMQRYRAWGHRRPGDPEHLVNGAPSEKNFPRDHDWSKDPFGSKYRDFVPERAVFGLPQNYGKGFGVAPAPAPTAARMDRRASPLFLHIHPLAANVYLTVALLLPAQFLPGNRDEVAIFHPSRPNRPDIRRARIDWTVLERFLDGPAERSRPKYFPQRLVVLPKGR